MKEEMTGEQWHANHLHSLQTDNHASSSSLNNNNKPDALPDVQPTVSKN